MPEFTSEWLAAVNHAAQNRGSIHDEERARQLGFAHAVVGAGMHIPLLTRMAVELFGTSWYERGFLKARFTTPVHEGQAIRAVFQETQQATSDERLFDVTIEREDGEVILSGYVGLLASATNVVTPWQRDNDLAGAAADVYDPLPLDNVGDEFTPKSMQFEAAESLAALQSVNDTCSWYNEVSPWGAAILPTHRFVRLPRLSSDLHPGPEAESDMKSSINSLFQVVHLRPVFCGPAYSIKAKLVSKGFSGRTAYRSSEAWVMEGEQCLAMVRQTLRWIPERAMLARS